MTPFLRPTRPTTATSTATLPTVDPSLDPDDPLHVPDELRQHYVIDPAAEARAWDEHERDRCAQWKFRKHLDDDPAAWQRYAEHATTNPGNGVVDPRVAPRSLTRREVSDLYDAGPWRLNLRPQDWDRATADLTDDDRERWFHTLRLHAAREAHQREQDRRAAADARYLATVCSACGQATPTTRVRWLVAASGHVELNRKTIPTDARAAQLCHPCAAAVQLEAQHRAAADTLPDGRTRAEAAATWLDDRA